MKNKLKLISVATCCFVVSLWGQAQCTNQLDILESDTNYHTISMQTSLQNKMDALDSKPLQSINLEDSQDSWSSYLISPLKSTMQMTSQFMELATNNPKLAMVVGVAYTLQLAEALPYAAAASTYYQQYCCIQHEPTPTPYGSGWVYSNYDGGNISYKCKGTNLIEYPYSSLSDCQKYASPICTTQYQIYPSTTLLSGGCGAGMYPNGIATCTDGYMSMMFQASGWACETEGGAR